MPLDGLTMCHIARELNGSLAGGRIDRILQPETDEVLIQIYCGGKNHTLLLAASAGCARAQLTGSKKRNPLEPYMLNMLMRKHLTGGRVRDIVQLDSDRVLRMSAEHTGELGDREEKYIYLECMGKYSNIIFTDGDGRILDSARRVNSTMSSVREVLPGLMYESAPPHGKVPFDHVDEDELARALSGRTGSLAQALQQAVSGLSRQTAREAALRARGSEDAAVGDPVSAAHACAGAFPELLEKARPRVVYAQDGVPLDFTAVPYRIYEGMPCKETETVSEAMEEFYRERDLAERIAQKSQVLSHALKLNIERCEKKLALQEEALRGSERMDDYRRYGELLTASLHLVKKGQRSASVPDWYSEGMPMVEIPLDEKLSPGANAERYYKLYRKARSAQKLAAEQIEKTREELEYLLGQKENLRKCDGESELSELRQELEQQGYIRRANARGTKSLPESKPLRFTTPSGCTVLVGKNNLQNDKLTRTALPNEYWFHVKNAPGSHVILADPDAGREDILIAARLAAGYSSVNTSENVEVDMTRVRYVKKPNGARPGFVIYTNQTTLVVDPTRSVDGE